MTNFANPAVQPLPGRHNMASDAFQALKSARAEGRTDPNAMGFADLIDTLNPLQHIPVVSTLYREITGDKLSPQARMAGGALYGGPIGLVTSMIDSAVDVVTGNDVGGHVFATLFGGDAEETQPTKVATLAPGTGDITASLAAQPSGAPDLNLAAAVPAAPAPASAAVSPAIGSAPKSVAQPLPQLSPEAFNALLNSFANPEIAKSANADMAAKLEVAKADETAKSAAAAAMPVAATPPLQARPAAAPPSLFQSMQSGLDRLDALKAANAKSMSVNALSTGAGF